MPYTKCRTPNAVHQMPYTKCRTPNAVHQMPYTKCHTPNAVHQTPYTNAVHQMAYVHQMPYTKCRTPNTVHQTPYTKCITPNVVHQMPYTKCRTPNTIHQMPYTKRRTPMPYTKRLLTGLSAPGCRGDSRPCLPAPRKTSGASHGSQECVCCQATVPCSPSEQQYCKTQSTSVTQQRYNTSILAMPSTFRLEEPQQKVNFSMSYGWIQ